MIKEIHVQYHLGYIAYIFVPNLGFEPIATPVAFLLGISASEPTFSSASIRSVCEGMMKWVSMPSTAYSGACCGHP